MNTGSRAARRYHWLSEHLQSFVDAPHTGIEGRNHGTIVNLTDVRAARARAAELELVRDGPDRTVGVLRQLARSRENTALDHFDAPAPVPVTVPAPRLRMPAHHDVRASDVQLRRLHATLAAAADRCSKGFRGPTSDAGCRRTHHRFARARG